jgi:hypothetical protein
MPKSKQYRKERERKRKSKRKEKKRNAYYIVMEITSH